jgi:hypothetical protein
VVTSPSNTVVAKWEGELLSEADAEANAARIDAELEATLAHPVET